MMPKRGISTWLMLLLLLCLFILCVVAPGTWHRVARRTTVEGLLSQSADVQESEPVLDVPLAPQLGSSKNHDLDNAWQVVEPAAAVASAPIDTKMANHDNADPLPLAFSVVGELQNAKPADEIPQLPGLEILEKSGKTLSPRVALIPDPSRRAPGSLIDPPLDSSFDSTIRDKASRRDDAKRLNKIRHLDNAKSTANKTVQDNSVTRDDQSTLKTKENASPDWPLPTALFEEFDILAENAATRGWALTSQRLAEALLVALSSHQDEKSGREESSHRASEIFDRLRIQNREAYQLADRLHDDHLAETLRRCGYSLRRRLDLWRLINSMAPSPNTTTDTGELSADTTQLAAVLQDVDKMMGNSTQAAAWREFLLIDALKGLAATNKNEAAGSGSNVESPRPQPAYRRAVAGEVLARVARSNLTEEQRKFLQRDALVALGTQLRRISDDTFDGMELVRLLEQYEDTNLPGYAHLVADESLRLAVSRDGRQKALGEQLAAHYCNPNIRIALTEELLNRLMPKPMAELSPVRDTVLGKPVRGQSLTETDVAVRLIPDPHRLLLALEISGDVASITNSTSGPATFRNASASRYVARKPMEITTTGITLGPAEVTAVQNNTRLQSVRTDFDLIPFLGSVIQGMARSSHDSKRPELRREIKRKVATRAKQRIDAETDSRLNDLSRRLQERLLEPLSNLEIEPEMIGAETTAERLVMQLRLASSKQLAAHTHRPWAPSDSLMSMQIHQTAINNVLGGLKLDGATFTLGELKKHIAEKLNLPAVLESDDKHDDAFITFAPRDAAHIDCRDGRIAVTLAIARLEKGTRLWRDFQVRAFYRAQLDGLSAELVRDGTIRMVGRRVRTSAQVAIRSIFLRVFSRNATMELIPERIRNNPKMSDQMVTQFEIDDGWVAMAMGARRD